MADIGRQIRYARKAKGWTQDDLAKALNVTRQTVSNYEAGKRIPDGEMLLNLSKTLGYSFEAGSGAFGASVDQAAREDDEARDSKRLDDIESGDSEGNSLSKQSAESEDNSVSDDKNARLGTVKKLMLLSAAVILLCVSVALLVRSLKNTQKALNAASPSEQNSLTDDLAEPLTEEKRNTAECAADMLKQKTQNILGKAYLRLVPSVEIMEGDSLNYWLYTFKMYEENGVSLKIDRVEEFIIGQNSVTRRAYGAGDLMAAGMDINVPALGEWSFTGGFPVQSVSGLGILVTATDANGEQLGFTGYIPLSEE